MPSMLYADACYGGIPISPITHGKHSYTPIGDIGTTLGRHSFHPWMFFLTPFATIGTTQVTQGQVPVTLSTPRERSACNHLSQYLL